MIRLYKSHIIFNQIYYNFVPIIDFNLEINRENNRNGYTLIFINKINKNKRHKL